MLDLQCDQVCRWIDWSGRDGKWDTSIDLVARERNSGEYTAIQCMFYEPTSRGVGLPRRDPPDRGCDKDVTA